MRELVPAWPPNASRSIRTVRKPSDAADTAAERPAGPAPTMTTTWRAGPGSGAQSGDHRCVGRLDQDASVEQDGYREAVEPPVRPVQQVAAVKGVDRVEVALHAMAVKQIAELVGAP